MGILRVMPGGRPPTLGQTYRVLDDGTRLTVADAIIRNLAAGLYVETAARAAGVHKDTLYSWLQRGARARRAAIKNNRPVPPAERQYVQFSDSVDQAVAEAEARNITLIQQLARGGLVMETVTRKVEVIVDRETGAEVEVERERTVKTERTLPDLRALTWWAERRAMSRWGQRGSLEVTGPGGTPLLPAEDRARDLADALRDFQAGADAAREVTRERDGDPA